MLISQAQLVTAQVSEKIPKIFRRIINPYFSRMVYETNPSGALRRALLISLLVGTLGYMSAQTTPKTVDAVYESLGLMQGQDSLNTVAIFSWITENVRYDVRAAEQQDETGNPSAIQTPEKVVRNRRAICEGYSNLFCELCDRAGIENEKVVGYAADVDKRFYTRSNLEPHAWNAVRVDEQWFLVDCTWGSGGIDEDKKFHFEQNMDYLFAGPDMLAKSHYPMDPIWQLRNDPLSLDAFTSKEFGPADFSMMYDDVIEAQLSLAGEDSALFANQRILKFDPNNATALSEISISYLNKAQQITVTQHERLLHAQRKHLVLKDKEQYFGEIDEIRELTELGDSYLDLIITKGDQNVAQYKRDAKASVGELRAYTKDQEKWLKQYFKNPRPL